MKIYIPRDAIGRLLGISIVFALTLLASYLMLSWVVWDFDPTNWTYGERISLLGISSALTIYRWITATFVVGQPVEE